MENNLANVRTFRVILYRIMIKQPTFMAKIQQIIVQNSFIVSRVKVNGVEYNECKAAKIKRLQLYYNV